MNVAAGDFNNCYFPYPYYPYTPSSQTLSFVWPQDNTERVKALEDEVKQLRGEIAALRKAVRAMKRGA